VFVVMFVVRQEHQETTQSRDARYYVIWLFLGTNCSTNQRARSSRANDTIIATLVPRCAIIKQFAR
jgi:hypothetical protein